MLVLEREATGAPAGSIPKVPHLRFPLQLDADTGRLALVEQDSAQEVAQAVYAVLATPIGARLDEPEFGITDPSFEQVVDDAEWLEAVGRWEPRAAAATMEELEDLIANVLVGVGIR